MIKRLTYGVKNKLLLIGGVVFLIIIYQVSIKKTIDLNGECGELEQKLENASNAPGKMIELQKLNIQMDRLLGQSNDNDVSQSLLSIVTNYCHENEITLEEFPKPILNSDRGTTVETNIITIEGGFNKLLKLVYLFEQHYKTGKVVSVHYKTKRDFTARKSSLTAIIYLQNIKQNDHET
jgi:hypothetical protein